MLSLIKEYYNVLLQHMDEKMRSLSVLHTQKIVKVNARWTQYLFVHLGVSFRAQIKWSHSTCQMDWHCHKLSFQMNTFTVSFIQHLQQCFLTVDQNLSDLQVQRKFFACLQPKKGRGRGVFCFYRAHFYKATRFSTRLFSSKEKQHVCFLIYCIPTTAWTNCSETNFSGMWFCMFITITDS